MSLYVIESPHTKEECMQALDEMAQQQPQMLDKVVFGCMSGEHTGWATIEADNEEEVRKMLPSNVRGKAKVVPVSKFNKQQIESLHH
jgi:hypothetical protein